MNTSRCSFGPGTARNSLTCSTVSAFFLVSSVLMWNFRNGYFSVYSSSRAKLKMARRFRRCFALLLTLPPRDASNPCSHSRSTSSRRRSGPA